MASQDIVIKVGIEKPINITVGQPIEIIKERSVNYIHVQSIASSTWTINHPLEKFPSVTVVDSAENTVYGDVRYISTTQIQVTFSAAFGGKAYLN
jgi:hypothetical protein